MLIHEMPSLHNKNTYFGIHSFTKQFLTFQQFLEYEELKNDSVSEYEEYEMYEDDFDFAERERAETFDFGVNLIYKLGRFKLLVSSDF